jgi:hypothetical protein
MPKKHFKRCRHCHRKFLLAPQFKADPSVVIPTSREFIVPEEVKEITVELWGGGGGGGARAAGATVTRGRFGGGGGSGAYIRTRVSLGMDRKINCIVGSGGRPGITFGSNGTDGGNTRVEGINAEGNRFIITAGGGRGASTNGGAGGTVPQPVNTEEFTIVNGVAGQNGYVNINSVTEPSRASGGQAYNPNNEGNAAAGNGGRGGFRVMSGRVPTDATGGVNGQIIIRY